MNHPNHQKDRQYISLPSFNWRKHFPKQYQRILPNQEEALDLCGERNGPLTLELPTGSGKTAIGITYLRTLEASGAYPLFYVVPNKTLVDQVKQLHPEVSVAYGRNEHQCLYYEDEYVTAEESPCLMLDCPHRVDQETGQTEAAGVVPCPYYQAKWEARQGNIIVCTMAFYFFSQLSRDFPKATGVVVDEAHRIAGVIRGCFSSEITDIHVERAIKLLEEIAPQEAAVLEVFLKDMRTIIKRRTSREPELLESQEIERMLNHIKRINPEKLSGTVRKVLKQGKVDPVAERETMKRLENLIHNLARYTRSLIYALPGESKSGGERGPLNYVYGTYKKERAENGKVQYRLFIKYYYAAPLIKKILPRYTLAYSATIGDKDTFGFETGIRSDYYTFPSDFPVENTRVFIPTDTANLAVKGRSRREPTRTLRQIAKACRSFARSGIRSLVVVVSEKERQKFLELASEEGVRAISYGNGVPPRVSAQSFKDGEGSVLVGTAANYGEGVDLPKGLAPVIFFLRPGYPHPKDPQTLFEVERFRNQRWPLWNWRVMIETLQVRGRNVRSAKDLGVTFFVSQQFRRFIPATLPEWLEDAYDGGKTFEECVKEAKQLLK